MKSIQTSFSMPVLLAALLAGGSVLAVTAYAMPAGAADGKPRCEARQDKDFQAQREERRANHMAALKEKLNLSTSQEAAWNKLVESAQPGQRPAEMDRQARREEFQKLNAIERLEKIQPMKEMRQARMAERINSLKEFYAQLTPEQQKVFDAELMNRRHERIRHHHLRFQS